MAEPAPRPGAPQAGAGWRVGAPRARFALRVNPAAAAATGAMPVATENCRARLQGDWAALWLGPDEQLLLGPVAGAAAMATTMESALSATPHSLVDVSHRQGSIEVAGPRCTAMLNCGCPLDLHLAASPVGFCTRTVYAKAEVVLWRRAEQEFHLEVWRSFMPYVTGLLALAERE